MLGFSQVWKPVKRQDLLEEGKDGCNVFRTGAKIHVSEKKYFEVSRGTLNLLEPLRTPLSRDTWHDIL